MLQLRAFLVLLVGCFVSVNNGQENFCRRHTTKQGLHFTDDNGPATLVIGCETEWSEIVCCTSNYRKIDWYQSSDNKTWREFMHINNDTRMISKDNQVATIRKLQRKTDSGYYKCVAHGVNDGETIENVAVIDIRNCSFCSNPPIPLNPRSNLSSVDASLMERIQIVCSSFSCLNCDDSDSDCFSGWYKRPVRLTNDGQIIIPESNSSSIRVRYTNFFSRNSHQMESVLTIENVTADDYTGEYVCFAMNYIGPTYYRIVRINPRSFSIVVPIIAGAAVAGVIVVFVVALGLVSNRTRMDLAVRIWWAEQLRKKPQDDADYDVALLFSGNEPFALYLKETLTRDFKLTVFSADDLNPGYAPIYCLPERSKRSRSVLVVMTPEVNDDEEFVAVIGDVISDVTPIFVLYRVDSADMDTVPHRNIKGAKTVRSPLRWPGTATLEEEQSAEHWKKSRSRQVRIFWKKLRLALLKMEKERVVVSPGNVRNDSPSGPLLTPTAAQPEECPKW